MHLDFQMWINAPKLCSLGTHTGFPKSLSRRLQLRRSTGSLPTPWTPPSAGRMCTGCSPSPGCPSSSKGSWPKRMPSWRWSTASRASSCPTMEGDSWMGAQPRYLLKVLWVINELDVFQLYVPPFFALQIDALSEIVDTVQGRIEVYLDGGIRTGSDVLKSLALGAKCVFIGRPAVWGLAYKVEHPSLCDQHVPKKVLEYPSVFTFPLLVPAHIYRHRFCQGFIP